MLNRILLAEPQSGETLVAVETAVLDTFRTLRLVCVVLRCFDLYLRFVLVLCCVFLMLALMFCFSLSLS